MARLEGTTHFQTRTSEFFLELGDTVLLLDEHIVPNLQLEFEISVREGQSGSSSISRIAGGVHNATRVTEGRLLRMDRLAGVHMLRGRHATSMRVGMIGVMGDVGVSRKSGCRCPSVLLVEVMGGR